jgi:hypothetical protein
VSGSLRKLRGKSDHRIPAGPEDADLLWQVKKAEVRITPTDYQLARRRDVRVTATGSFVAISEPPRRLARRRAHHWIFFSLDLIKPSTGCFSFRKSNRMSAITCDYKVAIV